MGDGEFFFSKSIKILTNSWQMYIINGTSGHANIYKNAKGIKFEEMKKIIIYRIMSKQSMAEEDWRWRFDCTVLS